MESNYYSFIYLKSNVPYFYLLPNNLKIRNNYAKIIHSFTWDSNLIEHTLLLFVICNNLKNDPHTRGKKKSVSISQKKVVNVSLVLSLLFDSIILIAGL
jgi:hypothetical protein